jgi:putative FmdB family regulatory protein
MPIYAYICPGCKDYRDIPQKIGAPAPACPTCKSQLTKQLTSPAGFQLNGDGY